jgi:phosphoglycolate phosphatase
VAPYVGKGAEVLVHRALGGGLDARVDATTHARCHRAFLRHYAVENGRHARPYDGVREGLDAMRAMGLRLACVTTSRRRSPIRCSSAADARRVRAGAGGDALPQEARSLPMLHAASRLDAAPDEWSRSAIGQRRARRTRGRHGGARGALRLQRGRDVRRWTWMV